MHFASWQRLWNVVSHRRSVRRQCRTGFRPRLESLEERALPCTINWSNAAGGLWHVADNWDLNRVPAATDDVCVPDFPGNIAVTHSQGTDAVRSLTNAEALVLSGGSLDLAGASAIHGLTLANGTLTGTGTLSIRGRFIWTGGTMSGTGTTQLEAGAELNFTGGAVTLGRNFDNAGTVTVLGPSSALTLAAGTIFNNQAGGLFHIRNDQNLNGSGTFNNLAGATFLRSTAGGDIRVAPRINNDGTLELRAGLLLLTVGGSHSGTFLASPNGQFRFAGGTHVLQAGSSLTAARVSAVNASVTVNGSYAVSHGTTVFAAAMTFTPAATVTSLGDEFYVYNGTADLSSGEDHTVPVASFSGGDTGGNLTGSDRITVTEYLTWYTGRMSGAGTMTVHGVLELSPFRNVGVTLARTLNNHGAATYSGHFGGFSIASQGVFNNLPGATFAIITNQPQIGGSGVFNNSEGATFRLLFDEALLPWVFNNSGLVELQRGRLVLRSGGSHRGTFATVPGTLLDFGGGTHDFQSTSSISASQVLFSAGTVNFSGTYDVSDGTAVAGGVVSFNPSAVVNNLGDALTVRGGTVNFNSGESLIASRFRLANGTLAGSDDLYVLDSLTWSGGSMIGSGLTAAFGEVALSGAGMTLGRIFANLGTATWTGVGNMFASPGAVFYNAGIFDVQNDQSFSSSCQAYFYNAGMFQKTAGYGTTTIGLVFSGEGTVDVQTGRVEFPCGSGPGGGSSPGGSRSGSAFLKPWWDGSLVTALLWVEKSSRFPGTDGWGQFREQ